MIQFRWLDRTDLAAWRDLRAEALRHHPSAFLTTLAEFQSKSDDEIGAQLDQGKTFAAVDDATLLASAAYLRHGRATTAHRAEIGAVYLRPAHRGSGLADRLMDGIEDRARRDGVSQLELNVEVRNTPAIRFYERRGFQRFGTWPGVVKTDTGLHDDYFYVKTLEA